MFVRWGAPYREDLMLRTVFVRAVFYPLNVYIEGLSNDLNNCTTGGFLGGKRINHMLITCYMQMIYVL